LGGYASTTTFGAAAVPHPGFPRLLAGYPDSPVGVHTPWLRPPFPVLREEGEVEVTEAATSVTVGQSSIPPKGVAGPSADRPGTPASIDQSIEPDDLGRPPQIVLDAEEAMPEVS